MSRIPQTILIIKLSAIGDVVNALPLLEVLSQNFPLASIDWLVEEDAFSVIEGHPALRRIIVSRRKSWQRRLKEGFHIRGVLREMGGFVREVRKVDYDLVLDVQGLLKSGILTGVSRGKRKIGLSDAREMANLFFTEEAEGVNFHDHAVDRYLTLARHLGCAMYPWDGAIPISEKDKEQVDRLLSETGLGEKPFVAINPVARWESKLWDSERFAQVGDWLRDTLRCDLLFTGARGDKGVIEGIMARMTHKAVNLAGRTSLKELACLYTRCQALITTDTGPMHIAVAMGCPTVALFGPTAPWRTGPYGPRHQVVRSGADCSPCFRKHCAPMTCMRDITVDQVVTSVAAVLKGRESKGR